MIVGSELFALTILAEDQELADEVVENDDQHGGDDLEKVFVETQPGAEHEHDGLLQQQGHHTSARKGGDLDITALVEDGMFEENIMYPVALYSEMLWNCNGDIKELMREVAQRSYVSFA